MKKFIATILTLVTLFCALGVQSICFAKSTTNQTVNNLLENIENPKAKTQATNNLLENVENPKAKTQSKFWSYAKKALKILAAGAIITVSTLACFNGYNKIKSENINSNFSSTNETNFSKNIISVIPAQNNTKLPENITQLYYDPSKKFLDYKPTNQTSKKADFFEKSCNLATFCENLLLDNYSCTCEKTSDTIAYCWVSKNNESNTKVYDNYCTKPLPTWMITSNCNKIEQNDILYLLFNRLNYFKNIDTKTLQNIIEYAKRSNEFLDDNSKENIRKLERLDTLFYERLDHAMDLRNFSNSYQDNADKCQSIHNQVNINYPEIAKLADETVFNPSFKDWFNNVNESYIQNQTQNQKEQDEKEKRQSIFALTSIIPLFICFSFKLIFDMN